MRTLTALVFGFAVFALPSSRALDAQGPPPAQPPAPCTPAGTVQFVCDLAAPEDLVVVPGEQWVVAGAYGGRGGIYLIHARDRKPILAYPADNAAERLDASLYKSCPGAPDAGTKAKFQTHGLFLLPGANNVHKLFVVLHGGRESVEIFDVDARKGTPVVTWVGCAVAPEPIGLNSVRGLPDGGFIATNFLARSPGGGGLGGPAMKAMMSGEKNGELWEWHPSSSWQKLPGTETAGANGLELSQDGKTMYVAAWGTQSFFRVSRGAAKPERNEIQLGFRVDNIRWSRDGSILATGQGGTPAATVIVKIDPRTLAVRELVRHPDTPAYGAGTVAVEIGSDLWVGSFRGDRLAIFPAPQ